MARILLQPAYVLHRRAFSETSLTLEIFTPEFGRLGVLAKGARRGRAPKAALLQPFRPLRLSWSGRGSLPVLGEVECVAGSISPQGDEVVSAFYLNELLMRLLPRHDPYPELFVAYHEAMARLGEGGVPLRGFELCLLESLGYGLVLTHDSEGLPLEADRQYHYRVDTGACVHRVEDSTEALPVSGRTLLALADSEQPGGADEAEARRLLRFVLRHYLGDRPLKSRELIHR